MTYRTRFDEAIGQPPPSRVDVERVVQRQRRGVRIRRGAAGLAAVTLAATGIGGGAALLGSGPAPQQWADPGSLITDENTDLLGFTEYMEGTRVVGAATAAISDGPLILTFTPSTLDLVALTACEPADQTRVLYAEIEVGEVTGEWPMCPTLGVWGDSRWTEWSDFWADTGVAAGEPVTVTVTPTKVRPLAGGGEETPPDAGMIGLAVAEPVPFEEYEFPPRPGELAPLPERPGGAVELRPDPSDPGQRVEQTLTWDAGAAGCGEDGGGGVYPLELVAQTPGKVRVLINDVPVAAHTWWDFEQHSAAYPLTAGCDAAATGEEVTIAVEPEHLTGDWRVWVNQSGG